MVHQKIRRRPRLQEMAKYLVCNSSQNSRCILIRNSVFLRSNWDPFFYGTHHPQAPTHKEANGPGSAIFLANRIGCRRGIREELSQTFELSTISCSNTSPRERFPLRGVDSTKTHLKLSSKAEPFIRTVLSPCGRSLIPIDILLTRMQTHPQVVRSSDTPSSPLLVMDR